MPVILAQQRGLWHHSRYTTNLTRLRHTTKDENELATLLSEDCWYGIPFPNIGTSVVRVKANSLLVCF